MAEPLGLNLRVTDPSRFSRAEGLYPCHRGPDISGDSRLFVSVIRRMDPGQHPFMEDTGNQNPALLPSIEYDMFAMLKTAQARTNVATRPP
jgi:hypothetical protein